MAEPRLFPDVGKNASLEYCRKLTNQFVRGLITFPEYAANMTLAIVSGDDDCMPDAVKMIPSDVVAQYSDYLGTYQAADYMPCPRPFLVGDTSEERIEQTKQQLRPRYIRLHHLVNERLR